VWCVVTSDGSKRKISLGRDESDARAKSTGDPLVGSYPLPEVSCASGTTTTVLEALLALDDLGTLGIRDLISVIADASIGFGVEIARD